MKQLFSKVIGPLTIEVDEEGGTLSLKASGSISLGGGASAGGIAAVESLSVVIKGQQEVDALLLWAEKKYPAEAGLIEGIKAFIDPMIAKL